MKICDHYLPSVFTIAPHSRHILDRNPQNSPHIYEGNVTVYGDMGSGVAFDSRLKLSASVQDEELVLLQ